MSQFDADGARMDLRHVSIPNAARNAALTWPDEEALVDGEDRWTFTELKDRMLAAVRASIALGVEPGDRVALWGPNSARWIFAALGIQGAGGILVPLNTRFKPDEVAYVLAKSGAKALFSVGQFLGVDYLEVLDTGAPEALSELSLVCLGETSVERALGWDEFLEQGEATSIDAAHASIDRVAAEDLSDIMFTSGTTGSPKGVKLTHGQSLRTFGWLTSPGVFGFRAGDRNLVIPPFFHAFGYKCGWMADLIWGSTTIPMPVFDLDQIVAAIEREKVSIMLGPPTLFVDLINYPRRADFDLSSLRVTVPSAANVPPGLYGEIERELGFETVLSGYGLTEATAVVAASREGDDLEQIANSVGRPMADAEVIVADDDGKELPVGEQGEILIRGYNVMSGYWDDPEATAEAIDPDGWLHTGDIGVFNDRGFLRITDRKKDMVIVGGFNVYPAEVERILAEHEAVAEAAVVGVEDDRLGEVTVAFVILRPKALVTPAELIAWSREKMANFKVPRHVAIVEELPRNASMKVLKPELRDRARGLAGRASA
jgi:acyl-CoA synthetase (AMP-forming)/AMP-acid ligase II